jgi:hypothetical protein
MTESTFPPYPTVDDLPAGMTEKESYEFAFRVMAEQGDRLGDYLFAAVRQAGAGRGKEAWALMDRWIAMSEMMESIHGSPITLTYRACDRIKAEESRHS